jgi:spastin
MISNLISAENHSLSDEQIDELSLKTEGYSGADIKDLCRESAMQSFRESSISDQLTDIQKTDIRGITFQDFITSLKVVKPSVASDDLIQYDIWNQKYGTLLASNNAL